MKKRRFSILLAALMVVTLLTATALAVDFSGYTALTAAGGTLSGGNYYLNGDVTLTNDIIINGDVTIDLNGYVLKGAGNNSVITVPSGATLTLTDSASTATHTDASLPAGGVITGGKADGGTGYGYGGGVHVTGGAFTMTGGTITDCSATGTMGFGGGVSAGGENAKFTMTGGSITNCTATGQDRSYGGGVHIYDLAVFEMTGGSITDCSAVLAGGAVGVEKGSFTMSGSSTVIDNCSAPYGGGVWSNLNTAVTMTGGSVIKNCKAVGGNGGGVKISGTFSMTGSSIESCSAGNGGGLYYDDATLIEIKNDSSIKNCTSTSYGGGVYAKSGTTTMTDSSIEGCTAASSFGGGVSLFGSGIFSMTGSSITGCGANYGGGAYIEGSFTMSGTSSITNCTATQQGGGVNNAGTFNMAGGSVTNCTAVIGGGIKNAGTFTMTGGSITFCNATGRAGGVFAKGTVTMTGGSITYCTATNYGGGVSYEDGTLTLGGTAKITGNVKGGTITDGVLSGGTANNVHLASGKTATLGTSTSAPTTMSVGVTLASGTGAFTGTAAATDTQWFTSDNALYTKQHVTDHLELVTSWMALNNALNGKTTTGIADLFEIDGSTVKLLADITAAAGDKTLTVSGTKVLDLNGHVINANSISTVGSALTVPSGATLTLTDSGTGAKHYFTVGSNGLWTLYDSATAPATYTALSSLTARPAEGSVIEVPGGVITGGSAPATGTAGGVHAAGTVVMNGGSIVGNETVIKGGGVYISANGKFTLNDGAAILGNVVTVDNGGGGGVAVDGGMLEMTGGRIAFNYTPFGGGGVFIVTKGSITDTKPFFMTMTGGEIAYNKADDNGGGVCTNMPFEMSGGSIKYNSGKNGGGVRVTGSGSFTMTAGEISNNTTTTGYGGGVSTTRPFTMSGGSIESNSSSNGGGVRVDSNGSFTITGGTISNNTATDGGGGVSTNNSFTMSGGSIEYNSGVNGGGVRVSESGSFTMTAGEISNNTATNGGGVSDSGTVTLGGTAKITGNVKGGKITDGVLSGGTANNVLLATGKTITLGASTSAPTAMSVGVTLASGTGAFTGTAAATDTQWFTSDNALYTKQHVTDHLELVINPWTALQSALTADSPTGVDGLFSVDGSTIKLLADITAATGDKTVMIAGTKVLDLNGHVINANSVSTVGSVITVSENANLTIQDSGTTAKHYFTVGSDGLWTMNTTATSGTALESLTALPAANTIIEVPGGVITGGTGTEIANSNNTFSGWGGGIYVNQGAVVTLNAGTICGNAANGSGYGGGVYSKGTFKMTGGAICGNARGTAAGGLYNDAGTFTMTGGAIKANRANSGGGGVINTNSGKFTMTDGTICGNTAYNGGGVNNSNSIFEMTGGTICGNEATNGGGVYSSGTFTMTGGAITGNTATTNGGGVFDNGIVTLGGTVKITENKKGTAANNVYLPNGKTVTLSTTTAPVTTGDNKMSIGVTTKTAPAAARVSITGANGSVDYSGCFTSDNADYAIINNASTSTAQFVQLRIHEHSWTYTASGNQITATCGDTFGTCVNDAKQVTLTLTAPADLVYSSSAKTVTFATGEADAWKAAIGSDAPAIIYTAKESSALTDGKAINAGTYIASITVDTNKTATIEFTITKATPYIKTAPEPADITYGQTLADSTLYSGYVQVSSTNTAQIGGLFEWTNGTTAPAVSDSNTTEYEVTFTPIGEYEKNYAATTCKVKLAVLPAAETAPAEGVGYTLDYAAETLIAQTGYEVSTTNSSTAAALTDHKVTPGNTYYVRKQASDGNHAPSAWVSIALPARPAAPASAPVLAGKTDTTVTVTAVDGQEYSIDNGANWVTGTNGEVTFSGLSANSSYSIITRTKAVTTSGSEAFASENSTALTGTTKTAPAAAPSASATVTDTTVTLSTNGSDTPFEYSADGTTWQDSNVFTGLTPASAFTYYVRVKETDTAMPSEKTTVTGYTAYAAADGDAYTINYDTETIALSSGYEISLTDAPGFSAESLTDGKLAIEPDTTYYVRKATTSDPTIPESATIALELPARPAAPASAPTLVSKTDTAIVVEAVDGQEYSKDGGTTWVTGTDGEVTFSGLSAGTEYSIITRVKATEDSFRSDDSAALTETTKTAPAAAPEVTLADAAVTEDSVTLPTSGDPNTYEYSTDGGQTWQTSNEITDLTPATQFTCLVRVAETETAMPSEAATITGYTAYATPASADEAGTVNYAEETFTPDSGYEISLTDGADFSAETAPLTIEPGKTYYIRKAASGSVPASETVEYTVPARPAAPSGVTARQETIVKKDDAVLRGVTEEMEYWTEADGVNVGGWRPGWDGGSIGFVFDSQPPVSRYDVKVRLKATDSAFAGEEATFVFTPNTTDKLTVTLGDTTRQAAYGDLLTKPADPEKDGYTFGGWFRDEACTDPWNFGTDVVTEDLTLYPKWIEKETPVTPVGGIVTEGGSAVPNATVELKRGSEVIAATTTDENGSYSFDNVEVGTYNLVVTEPGGKAKTELATVETGSSAAVDVVLPASDVSSEVELAGSAPDGAKSELQQTVVGGLDAIAEAETPADGESIRIKLTVEPVEDAATTEQEAIKAEAGSGKNVEFIELTLTKETNGVSEDIGGSNAEVLTIVIPFDFTDVKLSSVTVLRYHDGIEKLKQNPADGEEGFKLDTRAGTVTVFAKQFSTYAIVYEIGSDDIASTYPVNAPAATENGKVSISRSSAAAGEKVTLTAKPDAGYELDTITVTDKNGKEIALTSLGSGKFSFVMPDGKVNITATFKAVEAEEPIDGPAEGSDTKPCPKDETCPIAKFDDTTMDFWWHDGIHYCLTNGLMKGVSDTEFDPTGTTSRAMIVTILWRMEGEQTVDDAMNFSDVADGMWYTEPIRWAASEGIVKGYDDGTYQPNKAITREELATILYRYAQMKGEGFTGSWVFLLPFEDRADISGWADEAVHWCFMKGVILGRTETTFVPKATATRAEAATMIQRFCESLEK